jgi:uncharacterized iron-regulated membrane protein
MTIRKTFFWLHLAAGLVIGAVILSMSVTGMILAFEPQITEWSERHVRFIAAPVPVSVPSAASTASAPFARVGLDTLLAAARREFPGAAPADIRLWSDAWATVAVGFGKEKGALYVDPYSGKVVGGDSKVHAFLHQAEQWHRWLGSRKIWKPVIDAVSLAFAFMILSGLYLWWPGRWMRSALRAVSVPSLKFSGKARDWNWHNSIGLWAAPFLLVIALTGTLTGYRWANDLVFVLTGSPIPPRPMEEGSDGKKRDKRADGPVAIASLDTLLAKAQGLVPAWESISLRLPQKPGAPVIASILEPGFFNRYARSQATLNAASGEVLKWEPYSGQNPGRKIRSWIVPVHTGRALGIPGQFAAGLAACAAGFLVWTGLALAWRRFSKRAPITQSVKE